MYWYEQCSAPNILLNKIAFLTLPPRQKPVLHAQPFLPSLTYVLSAQAHWSRCSSPLPGLLLPQGLCTYTDTHMPLSLSDFTRRCLLGKAFPAVIYELYHQHHNPALCFTFSSIAYIIVTNAGGVCLLFVCFLLLSHILKCKFLEDRVLFFSFLGGRGEVLVLFIAVSLGTYNSCLSVSPSTQPMACVPVRLYVSHQEGQQPTERLLTEVRPERHPSLQGSVGQSS